MKMKTIKRERGLIENVNITYTLMYVENTGTNVFPQTSYEYSIWINKEYMGVLKTYDKKLIGKDIAE